MPDTKDIKVDNASNSDDNEDKRAELKDYAKL